MCFGDGRWQGAEIWALSPTSDVAVLRLLDVDTASPDRGLFLDASATLPSQGEWALVIGASQHGRETVSLLGLVSHPAQTFRGGLAEEAGASE